MLARAEVISTFHWRRICFQTHSYGVDRPHLKNSFRARSPDLTDHRRITSNLTYVGLSIELPHDIAANFPPGQAKEGTPEGTPDKSNSVFYNLILEVSSYHFCYILFIKSEWISSIHTQGKRVTPEYKYQKAGITEGHLRGCLPKWDIPVEELSKGNYTSGGTFTGKLENECSQFEIGNKTDSYCLYAHYF